MRPVTQHKAAAAERDPQRAACECSGLGLVLSAAPGQSSEEGGRRPGLLGAVQSNIESGSVPELNILAAENLLSTACRSSSHSTTLGGAVIEPSELIV
jgi:hypothetical protein